MNTDTTQRLRQKAQAVRASWEKLSATRKAQVYTAVRGARVGGLGDMAKASVDAWFYGNWASAYAYLTDGGQTDLALKAANWLDAVSDAVAQSAAKVRDAIHAELLYVALLAGGVLLAVGYANRR